jgi:hypothetical protein
LPWSNPNYIPGAPHNLPARPDAAVAASTSLGIPGDTFNIRENYRYASLITVSLTVGTTSIKFLDQPIGKRNFLGFRNASGSQNLYVEFNGIATTGSWMKLVPGQIVVFDTVVPQDDLYVVSDTAGGTFAYAYSTFPG